MLGLRRFWAVQPFISYFFVAPSYVTGTRKSTKQPRRGSMSLQSLELKLIDITLLLLVRALMGHLESLSKSCSPLHDRAVCRNLERWTAWQPWQVTSHRKDNKIFVYIRQMEGQAAEAHGEAGTFVITQRGSSPSQTSGAGLMWQQPLQHQLKEQQSCHGNVFSSEDHRQNSSQARPNFSCAFHWKSAPPAGYKRQNPAHKLK